MSYKLQIIMFCGIIIFFILLFKLINRKSLSLKYSLLWIFAGIIMGIIVIYPNVLYLFVTIIDIKTPVNGLFTILISFILIILMSITSIVSKQTLRIKNLVQYCALLEKRLRDLENSNNNIDLS